jgi:hypothetical protein
MAQRAHVETGGRHDLVQPSQLVQRELAQTGRDLGVGLLEQRKHSSACTAAVDWQRAAGSGFMNQSRCELDAMAGIPAGSQSANSAGLLCIGESTEVGESIDSGSGFLRVNSGDAFCFSWAAFFCAFNAAVDMQRSAGRGFMNQSRCDPGSISGIVHGGTLAQARKVVLTAFASRWLFGFPAPNTAPHNN